MGHRFSKSPATCSNGTSATQTVKRQSNKETSRIASTVERSDSSSDSLSSVSSNCQRFIIKIQLTKMENGNEQQQHLGDNKFLEECLRTNADRCNSNTQILNVTVQRSCDSGEGINSVEVVNRALLNGTAGSSALELNAYNALDNTATTSKHTDRRNGATAINHNYAKEQDGRDFSRHQLSTNAAYRLQQDHQDNFRANSSSSDSSTISITSSIWTPNNNDVIIPLQSPQFVVVCPQSSLLTLGRIDDNSLAVVAAEIVGGSESKTLNAFPSPLPNGVVVHSQVDFVHYLVPDLDKITNASFYWGKMDRYEAERLLDGKPEGTFLLRDSAQEEYLFSVTFRKYGRSLHARIEQSGHKFSFDCHDPCVYTAPTVTGLLEHYKDPACVMFFEPTLTVPLHRTTAFSLQQLCRATIVSNTTYDGINRLELPTRLKSYLKEYHYKQKLRTKPCDENMFMSI